MNKLALAAIAAISVAQAATVPTVTIKWSPVTTYNDGSPIIGAVAVSYNLYGGHTPAGPWSAAIPYQGTSAVRSGVDLGQDCYYVTAVINGKESLPTQVMCLNVTETPSTIPSTPANATAVQTQ